MSDLAEPVSDLAERVLTVREAAALLGVAERTYRSAAAKGQVPAVRIGRRVVVPGAALARLLGGGDAMTDIGAGNGSRPPTDAASRA